MRAEIVPGAVFPDYELSDQHGTHARSRSCREAMLQRCRPDWDISSAELRTAWANGEKARFHPYGKTLAQSFAEQD